MVSWLLQQPRIDPNKADENGRTPLHRACFKGNTAVVTKLLQEPSINVDLECKNKKTPFHWAAQKDHADLMKPFLNHPKINICDAMVELIEAKKLDLSKESHHKKIADLITEKVKLIHSFVHLKALLDGLKDEPPYGYTYEKPKGLSLCQLRIRDWDVGNFYASY